MGEPVKIRYLAEQMVRLSGREPGRDVQIQYIGLRPGEKLFEELFYASEDLTPTRHPKIRVARGTVPGAAATNPLPLERVDALARAVERQDTPAMLRELSALIPGWRSGTVDGSVPAPTLSSYDEQASAAGGAGAVAADQNVRARA